MKPIRKVKVVGAGPATGTLSKLLDARGLEEVEALFEADLVLVGPYYDSRLISRSTKTVVPFAVHFAGAVADLSQLDEHIGYSAASVTDLHQLNEHTTSVDLVTQVTKLAEALKVLAGRVARLETHG